MRFFQRIALAAAAWSCHLLVAHVASAQANPDALFGHRWSNGLGDWPPAAYTWLSGDFIGHKNNYQTSVHDLAMVWSYDNMINIDLHYSEVDSFGRLNGPHLFSPPVDNLPGQGYWPSNGVQWVAGDFDHDGLTDIVGCYNDYGGIGYDAHMNNGSGSFFQRLPNPYVPSTNLGGWVNGTFVAGDFDGDGWDDIALVWGEGNAITIDVHVNLHASDGIYAPSFAGQRWVTGQGGWVAGATILAGNFDDKPGDDIAYVFPAVPGTSLSPSVDIHSSLLSAANGGFEWSRWSSTAFLGSYAQSPAVFVTSNVYGRANPANTWKPFQDIAIAYEFDSGGDIDFAAWNLAPGYQGGLPGGLAQNEGLWPQYVQYVGGDFDGDGFGDVADVFAFAGTIDIDVHDHNPSL